VQASFHWHIKEIILALKSFEIDLLAAMALHEMHEIAMKSGK